MSASKDLTFEDKFAIFEQCNLHQRIIDMPFGREAADRYNSLYWPEGTFTVNDLRHTVFSGFAEFKKMFDYAHSVFPFPRWFHTMGPLEIEGSGNQARVGWRWTVNWREGDKGVVSTGTYEDTFEKRDGVWKCMTRVSNTDANWPKELFQTYIDKDGETARIS